MYYNAWYNSKTHHIPTKLKEQDMQQAPNVDALSPHLTSKAGFSPLQVCGIRILQIMRIN